MQQKIGKTRVLSVRRVEPLYHRMNCSVSKTKSCCGEYIGDCGIDGGIVAFISTDVLVESLWANDFGDVVSHGNNLGEGEN